MNWKRFFALLLVLALLPALFGNAFAAGPKARTLTVYIKRLRDKLEDDPQDPALIRTVRGVGYRMEG